MHALRVVRRFCNLVGFVNGLELGLSLGLVRRMLIGMPFLDKGFECLVYIHQGGPF